MTTEEEREKERARARAMEARALVLDYLDTCREFKLTPSLGTAVKVTWLGSKDRPWHGLTVDDARSLFRAVYAQVTAERKRKAKNTGGPGAQLPDPPTDPDEGEATR